MSYGVSGAIARRRQYSSAVAVTAPVLAVGAVHAGEDSAGGGAVIFRREGTAVYAAGTESHLLDVRSGSERVLRPVGAGPVHAR
jgi:hypothetical protein